MGRLVFISIAFIASFVAVLHRGGAVEWYALTLLAGLIVVSGLLPLVASIGLDATRRSFSVEVVEGQDACIEITFQRSWRIPFVWIAIEDSERNESGIDERPVYFRSVHVPMFSKEQKVTYSLKSLTRGVHCFSPISVIVGDWLGMTAIRRTIIQENKLLVIPAVPHMQLLLQAKAVGEDGRVKGHLPQHIKNNRSSMIMGLNESSVSSAWAGAGPDSRPYRDGDPLRNLDFRAAARGRGLFTKVYSGVELLHTYILIDQYRDAYKGDNRLFDTCISWALRSVKDNVEQGHSVTVITNDWIYEIANKAGVDRRANMSELTHQLAYLRVDSNAFKVERLSEISGRLIKGGTLKLFSPDWQGDRRLSTLADYATEHNMGIELYLIVRHSVATFAMREQSRKLEGSGMKVHWVHMSEGMETWASSEEGVNDYAI